MTQTLQLLHGDCVARMAEMGDESVRAFVCDPPYHISFMGKTWDAEGSGIAFSSDLWGQVYRVLMPGGVVKAFSGTRTFHRMAAAMEEAGLLLEPQEDLEAWLYGSGFPKSLNVGKAIAAHKLTGRSDSTVTGDGQARDRSGQHWSEFPTGRTNSPDSKPRDELWDGWHTALKPSWEPVIIGRKPA